MDPAVLETALDRAPVYDDGRSGAKLERVFLADGAWVIVKRFDPSVDLVIRLIWRGWNKALDIVEHPTRRRERELAALPWWLRQAELAFGTGFI